MNQKQKCIILSLCLRIASPRKPWEFYLSYTSVEGEGDKRGKVDTSILASLPPQHSPINKVSLGNGRFFNHRKIKVLIERDIVLIKCLKIAR